MLIYWDTKLKTMTLIPSAVHIVDTLNLCKSLTKPWGRWWTNGWINFPQPASPDGGFHSHSHGATPIAGWFTMENPQRKNGWFGSSPHEKKTSRCWLLYFIVDGFMKKGSLALGKRKVLLQLCLLSYQIWWFEMVWVSALVQSFGRPWSLQTGFWFSAGTQKKPSRNQ